MATSNDHRCRPLASGSNPFREIDQTMAATGSASLSKNPTALPHRAHKPSHRPGPPPCSRSLAQDPNIKPVGNGHQFSYQRDRNPEQRSQILSPSPSSPPPLRSPDACGVSDDDQLMPDAASSSLLDLSGHDEDDLRGDVDSSSGHVGEGRDDDLEMEMRKGDHVTAQRSSSAQVQALLDQTPASDSSSEPPSTESLDVETSNMHSQANAAAAPHLVFCDWVIEEIDSMGSDCDGLEVLFPNEVESNHSQSRSQHKEFDRGMMRDFQHLKCSNEICDDEADWTDDEEARFHRRQKEIRRSHRFSMTSSYGKRTHSELSDSEESDVENLEVNDVESSARRMRKRLHRGSLLFHDPPPPRIDELDEPNSGDDEHAPADLFARELPYWTVVEIMEMDSA